MTINRQLFRDIADAIETDPASYNQKVWGDRIEGLSENQAYRRASHSCGTAFCIAGHAAHLSGWLPTVESYYHEGRLAHSVGWDTVRRPRTPRAARYSAKAYEVDEVPNKPQASASAVGQLELGLTEAEAEHLFSGMWKPKGIDGRTGKRRTVPQALRYIARTGDVFGA